MRAVDSNILVRLLARDDPKQIPLAEAFIANGAWISLLVLAEALWVLRSIYGLAPAAIASAVVQLLDHEHFTLQEPDVVAAALADFRARPAAGFSDCLILAVARKNGHLPLGTFDRTLAKLEGVQRL